MPRIVVTTSGATGADLVRVLGVLASPHRIRVLAALTSGRNYVSGLARDLGISRPLLQGHLKKLESASLVTSALELSADGKAMKYYQLVPFSLHLTPESVAEAARTIDPRDTACVNEEGEPR